MMREKILLLRPDKAGDALKTLPVLRALKARIASGAEFEVHLLASEHNSSLFEFEPQIALHVLPKAWKKMKAATFLESTFGTTGFFFHRVVSLLCDESADVNELLLAIPAVEKFAAWTTPVAKKLSLPYLTPAGHDETLNIARLVSAALGVDLLSTVASFPRAPVLSLRDEQEAEEKMGTKAGEWLGFCPFAGNQNRTQPLRKWEKFVARVTAEPGFSKFFLFGAPADFRRLDSLRQASSAQEKTELAFPSSFRTLAAYLRRLDGVVAVDSGPLHLARALGVRSLGILSGGDQPRWYPPVNEGDYLLRRGILNRFPSTFEMMRAFGKWHRRPAQMALEKAPE